MYGYRIVPRLKLRGFRQLPVRFIVGELPALRDIPMYKLYHQWTQQYGPTFMYFAGASPIVVTSGAHSGGGAFRVVQRTGRGGSWLLAIRLGFRSWYIFHLHI